ncbi:MAG TPA: hypothetical protein VFG12_10575 [Rhodopila sp.]|jgi:putative Mn2+ efflux pump MntP|nr:hypothetical protein [Rhodopila sp.]
MMVHALSDGDDSLALDRVASTVLFGLAANTDNLTIGIAYGMKCRRIGWPQNLFIAILTTLATLLALSFGRQIRIWLPTGLPNSLAAVLLLVFAAWNIWREYAAMADAPSSGPPTPASRSSVGFGESLFLAGILSINNTGLAIAGGIGGMHLAAAAWSVFAFSVVLLALGQAFGTSSSRLNWLPLVRHPISGNAVLVLTGMLMLAGY